MLRQLMPAGIAAGQNDASVDLESFVAQSHDSSKRVVNIYALLADADKYAFCHIFSSASLTLDF